MTKEFKKRMGVIFFFTLLASGLVLSSCRSDTKVGEFKHVDLQGVRIHYNITGEGYPLILIHGSLADIRYWKEQDSVLSQNFRLITYSRRYNYPNQNESLPDHSAIVEAKDLLALMDKLNMKQAFILGHSYGAYTALWFALEHPERVKKLILAEPPLLRWLPEIPGGEGVMEKFMEDTWVPIGKTFSEKGEHAGLEFTSQWYFQTSLDSISQEWRTYMIENAKEWQALAVSSDAFPRMDVEKVKRLDIPTLLLSGALSAGNFNDLIDGYLTKLLPDNERIIIENAGHEMFLDNAEESNQAIIRFLTKNK